MSNLGAPNRRRRRLLQQLIAFGGASLLPAGSLRAARTIRFADDPFTLGVASGYPTPDDVVLWTRLAPTPLAPDGGMAPEVVPVEWEIASDAQFRSIVRSGVEYATPDWAHSVHVEPGGLEAGRPYWYRFTAGGARSPVGRTATAAAGWCFTRAAQARRRLVPAVRARLLHGIPGDGRRRAGPDRAPG